MRGVSERPHPDTQIWPPDRAAMAVECPVCGAAPDEPCEVDGEPCVHLARFDMAGADRPEGAPD
jgi:hypothetical protein